MLKKCTALSLLVCCLFSAVAATQAGLDDEAAVAEASLPEVIIVLNPIQDTFFGAWPKNEPPSWNVLPWVGGLIDSAVAYSRHKSESTIVARSMAEITDTFPFHHAVVSGLETIDQDAAWRLFDITEYEFTEPGKKLAQRVFNSRECDSVFFLSFAYYVTPGLNQIRLSADLSVFLRPDNPLFGKMLFERSYEYLSPSQGEILRPFHPGEKEALIAAIESTYEEKVAQFPHNLKAYSKDRKTALDQLEGRHVVLPLTAVNEGWPDDSFLKGLRLATDHVMAMLQEDLVDFKNAGKRRGKNLKPFAGFDRKGRQTTFKGEIIGTREANTIYRDKKGNIFSVP